MKEVLPARRLESKTQDVGVLPARRLESKTQDVGVLPARRLDEDTARELRALEPWRKAYGAFYGFAPELRTTDDGLSTFTFRREHDGHHLFDRMVGTLGRFANKPRLLEHLRWLGYGWNDEGLLLTMPLPASFRRRAAAALADSGMTPEILVLDAPDVPAGAWLVGLTEARAPIQVGTESLYARELRAGSRARGRSRERWERSMIHHLLSGLHDMTKHVLPFHLVPRSRLLELGERAVAAMGFVKRRLARELGWARIQGFAPKEWLAPVPLLSFYENDLVDYCHGVWNAIERPEDFEPTFVRSRHYAQLVDVLASRARQAKGLGAPWSRVWPRPYLRFEIDGPTRLEPRPRAGR